MDAREELIQRCAERRRKKIGTLSDEGFSELLLAVRQDPMSFVDCPEEQAMAELATALASYYKSGEDDDLLDDSLFQELRNRRLSTLAAACHHAAQVDPGCIDARLIELVLGQADVDTRLDAMLELQREANERAAENPTPADPDRDAWSDVFARPALRLSEAIARTCIESARYRMALSLCTDLMKRAPSDALGARFSAALCYARLEDEDALNELDAAYAQGGNTWLIFGRSIMLYKLGRMAATQRALKGFDQLSTGGAYVFFKPVFIDYYLPDRPHAPFGSFDEAVQVMYEYAGVLDDTPGFVDWAQTLDWLNASAKRFAERNDYDW